MSRSAFSSIVTRCHAKYDPMSLSVAYTTLLFARFACVLARWVFVFFIFQTMIFHTSILLYNSRRQGLPLAQPTNLSCAPQPLVAGSRRWRHRVRLDEAVISSRGGATIFGLGEPLSPSRHLPTRVAPPPSRRCQSLTTGALAAGGQGSSRRRLPAWPPSRRASKVHRPPAFSHAK